MAKKVIKIIGCLLLSPVFIVLFCVALATYYWWGVDYYRHVIN